LKSLIKNITKILVSIILLNIGLHAQKDTTVTADTINSSNIFEMHKSPWGAVARSAVIPGWGQIYNESYWKAPVVWGVMGWFVYVWIDNNNKYKDYKNLYIQYGDNSLYDYKRARDFYRDQRDQFAIYLVLTYFLNLVDAYVDAHLFDFSVDENYFTGQKMFNLRVNF
jgi:hypothetical protein